ncbi:synaptotagmin-17-like isoform X1 [Acanthaster planci]|uniref:Synaptotagmin-17 n=1 Tax=Acanthaster planci TaxID=133434 RepID=A0A8B7YVL0_ACAPL|nr:synaptotagmin-17-like isoform X1 [Acanthaster planci]
MTSYFKIRAGGFWWKLSSVCCHCRCCPCCDTCQRRSSSIEDLDDTFDDNLPICSDHSSAGSHHSRLPSTGSRRSSCNESRDSRRSSTPVSEYRRGSTPVPVIDMKPIEFWPPSTNQETVQPKPLTRRYTNDFGSFSDTDLKIEPKLYEVSEQEEDLTDEEKVARYKLGKIHYGLRYDVADEQLVVRIIKARDLPPPVLYDETRQDLAHSNPYVKICLLPDQKDSKQTTVKRKTQNPDFEEHFRFNISYQEAQRRLLLLSIQDFDKFSRHCVIGQHITSLAGLHLIKGGHYWKPLQPPNQNNPGRGELLISLNYLPSAGRLNVDVIKAKQLLQTDIHGGSDPFVKLQLILDQKVVKTKKTSTKKNTIDPVFNETFSLHVTPSALDEVCLLVSVWDYNSKSRDNFIGQMILGKYPSGPSEITHWQRMVHAHRSPVAQWHTLRTREECHEVFPSSSTVGVS